MNPFKPLLLIALLLMGGCSAITSHQAELNLKNKIGFDLQSLDKDGLYGVSDGKRALSYEFCIPADVDVVRQVMDIDPSLIIYRQTKGRSGCTDKQYLAMGDTFQKDYRTTLQQLVNLKYVTRIVEVYFE